MNNQYYNPADVLIGVREPFDKNSLWIHPHDGIVEIKIFEKGWKVILSTEDKGLSIASLKQVNELVDDLYKSINVKLKKHLGRISSDTITTQNKYKDIENRIQELEDKVKKLTNRFQTTLVKTDKKKKNGE